MRALRLIPLLLMLPACTTLRPVDSPVTYLERNNPEAVRIYTQQGDLAVLRAPRLSGNRISGFNVIEGEDETFDVTRIQRMEVKQIDRGRTTLFVGAIAALAGVGVYMIANAGEGKGLICDSYDNQNRCVPKPSSFVLRLAVPR